MAAVQFGKDSQEWQMFADYWNLCKKFWLREDGEEYWGKLVDDINDFVDKYSQIPLAKELALAFFKVKSAEQEEVSKKYLESIRRI